jgi:hypothetical protein
MHKLTLKYEKLIKTNKMTRGELHGLRKQLGACSSITEEEKGYLLNTLDKQIAKKGGIHITEEHTLKGINYLKSIAFKKDGTPRNTKNQPFGIREFETLKSFKYFRLSGLREGHRSYDGRVWSYDPIWKVVGRKNSFKYIQQGQWEVPLVIE